MAFGHSGLGGIQMGQLKALIGAAVGGAIGAGIWAAIAYNLHYEIGWIASIVGLLCGVGAAAACRNDTDVTTGVIAALVAVASVAGGKYLTVHFAVRDVVNSMGHIDITQSDAQLYMAGQLIEEYERDGTPLKWAEGKDEDTAESLDDYPANLRKDLLARWDAMTPEARESYRVSIQENLDHDMSEAMGQAEAESFFAMFDPLDLLFMFLAIVAAYTTGSGQFGGDDD